MNNPLFSLDIVICTYNNAALLDRVLTAIANQQVTLPIHWSVVVVNNNCTDDTSGIVQHHIQAGQIPQLRMVYEPKQGLTYARACGIENTTGDWIAFVDDDCLLAEDWLMQAVQFAQSQPDCGAFGGKVVLDWETPPPSFVLGYGYSFAQQDHGSVAKQVGCLVGAGLVIRRSALAATGWLQKQFMTDRVGKKLISGGDVELALRIAAKFALWYTPTCEIRHIIPVWRTTETYLSKINYGLGTSQIYGDSMLWSGSYLAWFATFTGSTFLASIKIGLDGLNVLRGRKTAADVKISWSFIQGRWAGIWKMLWMKDQERRALLGCAKLEQS